MTSAPSPAPLPDLSAENIARLRRRRRKIHRWIILFCVALIPLISFLELRLFKGSDIGVESNNILIFVLINVNVLLALIFLFLVLRNLAEVLFEGRTRRLGRRLKTKLIASFLLLSLIPTLLLFFVSMQFVTTSMDYWFDDSVEVSLQKSEVADSCPDTSRREKEPVPTAGNNRCHPAARAAGGGRQNPAAGAAANHRLRPEGGARCNPGAECRR